MRGESGGKGESGDVGSVVRVMDGDLGDWVQLLCLIEVVHLIDLLHLCNLVCLVNLSDVIGLAESIHLIECIPPVQLQGFYNRRGSDSVPILCLLHPVGYYSHFHYISPGGESTESC